MLAAVAGLSYCGADVNAATMVWDVNSGTDGAQDGNGTWTNGAGNWFNETVPLQNQNWNNAANDTAVFGAGGTLVSQTVTVSGTVNTNGMVFRPLVATSPAYIFGGAGTVALASGSTISVLDGASGLGANQRITFGSAISGENLTIQKTGGSALALMTISGTNSLTGTLSLRNTGAATGGLFVQVNGQSSLPSGTLTAVDVGTDATLVLGASGTWAVPFVLSGVGAGGRGAIRMDANGTILTGSITLAGNASITSNTGSTLSTINSNIGQSVGPFSLTLGRQGAGTNTVVLGGNNTFTGGLTIDINEVRINNLGALNSAAPNVVTFASSANNKGLVLNGFSVSVAGLVSSGGTGTISVRNSNAAAATLTIDTPTLGASPFGGVIEDGVGGGALSVVKNGAGTQALSGANTFTGGLTLNAGQLNINSATALGATASTFTINGGTVGNSSGGAIVNANNNAIVWNGNFIASPSSALDLGVGAISLGSAAGTVRDVNVTGVLSLTLGGSISDGATATGVSKSGGGTLVLGGIDSTYTGLTSVTGGNLRIRSDKALGGTAAGTILAANTRLQLENNITVTGEELITPYIENLSGANTWNGNVQAAIGATLTLDAAAGTLRITGDVNAASTDLVAHTFNVIGSGTGEVVGAISGTLSVNKTGSGTWVFSGANVYTSATNINGGNLQIGRLGVGQSGTGAVNLTNVSSVLSGTGNVRGNVSVTNGMIRAGDNGGAGVGTLMFATSVTFSPSSLATVGEFTLLSNGVGDKLSIASNLTLNANSRFDVVFDPTYTLTVGDSWDIVDWGGSLGLNGFDVGGDRDGAGDALDNLNLPDLTLLAGYSGQIWQVTNFSGSGALTVSIANVPEPTRVLLLAGGMLGWWWRRRRWRWVGGLIWTGE